MLNTNRGLLKYVFFSLLTFGIYKLVVMHNISRDINTIASPRDGKHTMNFLWIFFILHWITLGIATIVWYHKLSNRIGKQLEAENLPYSFGAGSLWIWDITIGFLFYYGPLISANELWIIICLLFSIGPIIYLHKLFKAMNIIADNYNKKLA